MGFDNKFKINFFLEYFWGLWDNAAVFLSLVSFSRIVVHVLTFALVFYGVLFFGKMFLYQLPTLSVVRAYFTTKCYFIVLSQVNEHTLTVNFFY